MSHSASGGSGPPQAALTPSRLSPIPVLPPCDKGGVGGGPHPRRAQQVAMLCLQMTESDVCLCSQDKR